MSFPIVFQALPKWDAPYNSTSLTVAKLLSKERKVFYVDHPFSWIDSLRSNTKKQRQRREGLAFNQPFEDHPNFYVINPPKTLPINSLNDGFLYQRLLKNYQKKLWKRIDRVLTAFGIDKFGFVNSFDPVYFDFNTSLECLYKIYHCVDLIEGEDYIAKHGVKAEQKACEQADFVITTSRPLAEKLRFYNLKTICIANASDYNHFSFQQDKPIEYNSSERSRIVYTGSIGHRIDYALIKNIAEKNPEFDVFMIGPKHPTYFGGQELELLSNVRFLGPRNYDVLPAYIQHADVLLIPFLKNELTHHIYPLKLNEYLATGKPIVSTHFTDLSEFDGLITISDTFKTASEAVNNSLKKDSKRIKNRRIQLASSNTWENRIKDWKQIIIDLESKSFID
jgi:glycosyltransferase involved in cell wall biosynthesis